MKPDLKVVRIWSVVAFQTACRWTSDNVHSRAAFKHSFPPPFWQDWRFVNFRDSSCISAHDRRLDTIHTQPINQTAKSDQAFIDTRVVDVTKPGLTGQDLHFSFYRTRTWSLERRFMQCYGPPSDWHIALLGLTGLSGFRRRARTSVQPPTSVVAFRFGLATA